MEATMCRRHTRPRTRRVVAFLVALSLAAFACEADEPTDEVAEPAPEEEVDEVEEEPAEEPTGVEQLTFAVTFEEGNLTPWNQNSGYPGYYMMTLVYDTLFWHSPDLEPQPWLVEDHEISDDGLEWTLNLHDDVTWHDGEPLTASDVAFTIDYLTEHPRPRFTPTFEPIESVETPDDHTVVFTLSEPQASFELRPLTDLPILPEHIWSEVEDPFEVTEELPIGSGPYRLVEFTQGELWRFEANPDYFRGAPIVDEIVMPFIADSTAAFLAVQTGEVDAVSASLSPELVSQFEEADDVEILEGAGFRGWYLIMNAEREPFDDPRFREALLYTIDVGDIVDTVLLGAGTEGSPGFVHRDAPWANPDTLDQQQDLDRANELLDELGYERGDDGVRQGPDGPLEFTLYTRAEDPQPVRTAELISSWADEVGIVLEVTPAEQAILGEQLWPDEPRGQFQGDYDIGVHSWAGVIHLDPDYLTGLLHSDPQLGGLSRTGYANPQFDEWTEEQERTVDQDERFRILHDMQALLAEEVPAIPLFYPDELAPYRPEAFDGWVAYAEGILNKATFLPG